MAALPDEEGETEQAVDARPLRRTKAEISDRVVARPATGFSSAIDTADSSHQP